MPVLDHDVHDSVRMTTSESRYGCNNRPPFKESYEFRGRIIEHTMSYDCRYDHSLTDKGCAGCPFRGEGEAYAQSIINQTKGT